MKYDKELEEFIGKYKFQWINVIDNVGKKHGGLLSYWNKNGTILIDGTEMHDPIIELQGTGASVSEIIAVNEIKSIYIPKLGTDNVTIIDVMIIGEAHG